MLAYMKYALLCPLLLLAACATPEQIAAQQQAQEQADSETCRGYGLRPGSEAFGLCRMEIDLARRESYTRDRYYYGGYGYNHGHPGHFMSGVGVGF